MAGIHLGDLVIDLASRVSLMPGSDLGIRDERSLLPSASIVCLQETNSRPDNRHPLGSHVVLTFPSPHLRALVARKRGALMLTASPALSPPAL